MVQQWHEKLQRIRLIVDVQTERKSCANETYSNLCETVCKFECEETKRLLSVDERRMKSA